jgi:hypothetical protein
MIILQRENIITPVISRESSSANQTRFRNRLRDEKLSSRRNTMLKVVTITSQSLYQIGIRVELELVLSTRN